MIFCGDIAIPFVDGVHFINVPEDLCQKDWFGNLEGSLVDDHYAQNHDLQNRRIVFNSFEALQDLKTKINFKAFGIANNHIKDAAEIFQTQKNLEKLNIRYVGAGLNFETASKPILITSDEVEYAVVAFGWDFIKCIYASESEEGVNPYTKKNVIRQAKKLCERFPNKRLIAFLHWNYELELYPQPLDREIAHKLIDFGFYSVLGCHAHRVQPIEIYRNRPIIYGLGNFAFRQGTYMKGKLSFPQFSYEELAVEITAEGKFIIHVFEYNPAYHTVTYKTAMPGIAKSCLNDLTAAEYKKFFTKKRVQRKALPIMDYEDSYLGYNLKKAWVKSRGKLIDCLVGNKKLFGILKKIVAKVYDRH